MEIWVVESFNFKEFLIKVISKGASDIHLHVDEKPYVRINGSMIRVNYPELSENDILELVKTMTPTEIRYDREYFYTNEIDNLIVVQYVNHRTETITYNVADNEELNDLVHKVVAREMEYAFTLDRIVKNKVMY